MSVRCSGQGLVDTCSRTMRKSIWSRQSVGVSLGLAFLSPDVIGVVLEDWRKAI